MKQQITYLMLALSLLLCTACSKEGAPQHKQRISAIYADLTQFEDNLLLYHYDSRLVEEWHWEDNELYRIDYYEDQDTYSENFYYNARHQIVQSTVPAYSLRTEITYDGRKMQRICIYQEDELMSMMELTHDGNHITHIDLTQMANAPTTKQCKAIQTQLGTLMGREVGEVLTQCSKAGATKGDQSTLTLTWKKDDLVQISILKGEESTTITYTYDNQHNPFYELFTLFELDNGLNDFGFHVMSEHNVVEKSVTPSAYGPTYSHYEYDEKGYPTVINLQQSYHSVSTQTGDDIVMTHKEQRRIEYL